MSKRRLRYSSRGWFRYWTKFRFGYRDYYTWAEMPDAQGREGWNDIWIGPFASFDDAARYKTEG